jgi:hypothetical protein
MTTLPATLVEAKAAVALAFARKLVARHQEPGGIFHPNAEYEYGRVLMKEFALEHPFGCDEIVYFAENGSKEADYALRELIAERTDRGEPLGAVLGGYAIKLLNPNRPPRTGPAPADNFLRDTGISLLVAVLMEQFGLRATRNTASKRASACSIAAQALTEAGTGILLTVKGVERIWQRYLPTFVGSRFAEIHFPAGLPSCQGGLFAKRPRSLGSN